MKVYRLSEPVTMRGKDFWGRDAWLRFSPQEPRCWSFGNNGRVTEIAPHCLRSCKRRLTVSHEDERLELGEHIFPLRFAGLVGVRVSGSPWPPYHGRTSDVWEELWGAFKETDERLPIYGVEEAVEWQYPKLRNDRRAFVRIRPARARELILTVRCSFPELGTREKVYEFPDAGLFYKILQARTLGRPRFLWPLSKAASYFGWPHHENIFWPRKLKFRKEKDQALDEIIDHRAQDLLGALALLCKDGVFAGDVFSECAGHYADLQVAAQAYPKLICI